MASTDQWPGQASILEGFLNLRGTAIPVLKLRQLFGLAPVEAGIYTPLIVVRLGDARMGLVVDRVDEVLPATDPGMLQPLPENHSLNECAEAQFSTENGGVVLLDCERLLLMEERKRVAELQAQAQHRLEELARP